MPFDVVAIEECGIEVSNISPMVGEALSVFHATEFPANITAAVHEELIWTCSPRTLDPQVIFG
jgi:hypothetical protein